LYEVDEAATRIREEVDQDANIIVGATFDESLEGIIRVSVVATGIDHASVQRQQGQPETALKELAGRVRSVRAADRIERAPAPPPAAANAAAIESAAHAAVAAALLPPAGMDDVSIRPMPMKPSLFEPAPAESAQAEPPMPKTFIPPAPDRPAMRTPRMPRIDELPLPAQNEIKAQRGELGEDHPEKRRMSLMQRLASVGLGRRGEEAEAPRAPRTAQAMPQFERPARPTARQPEGRADDPVSEYARRSAPQGLDPRGRPVPVHNSAEEDQLDIPAFLRRQAN
jgi:cell division protein FtsZ